jgi:hypothetical protein
MKKVLLLSVIGLLLAYVTVAKAAPSLTDGLNEATEVIEVQEDVSGSTDQSNDINANEAQESSDTLEQEDAQDTEANDQQETEVDNEGTDQQDSQDQQDNSGQHDSGDSTDQESGD